MPASCRPASIGIRHMAAAERRSEALPSAGLGMWMVAKSISHRVENMLNNELGCDRIV